MSSKSAVGFVGLGIMGLAMARNAQKAGFRVTAYNRSKARQETAEQNGIALLSTPKAVAEQSDAVVVMVSNPEAVRSVLNGPHGVLAAKGNGKTVLQMSTIDGPSTHEFAKAAQSAGWKFLDCPVTGSKKQVEEAQLILLAGGDEAVIDQWNDFLVSIGKAVVRAGGVGQGTALKLCMNLIVAQMTTALCEALALARTQKLPPEKVFEVLGHSPALNCGYFKIKEKSLLSNDFSPAFSLENMLKDVRFMTETAKRNKLELSVTEAVQSVMEKTFAEGYGAEDLTSIAKILN